MYTAPNTAPDEFVMMIINATSLEVSWNILAVPDRNGVIREYVIHITEVESQKETRYGTLTPPFNITNLHPYYTYHGKVAAVTVATGPFSPTVEVNLPESCKILQHLFSKTCNLHLLCFSCFCSSKWTCIKFKAYVSDININTTVMAASSRTR